MVADRPNVRLLQIIIPTGKREAILGTLDREDVEYILSEETSSRSYAAIAYVPLPKNAVESVLDDLRDAGLGEDAYTVVLNAETVISRDFDRLQQEWAEEKTEDRIAREELTARADELIPARRTYLLMTIISAVIAAAGLLLDSPAVVVGSMVIAPLIGPAMAASVGTVVVDDDLFRQGVTWQAVGVLLAVASAAVFSYVVKTVNLIPPFTDVTAIPEVRERLLPDFLSLVVALGAGVAGSLSLTAGVSSALVGVMIAVALIPPAATIGIGIAWGLPSVALGSGVLVLVNLLSINLAAIVVLRFSGYRPEQWFQLEAARAATIKRVAVLAIAILMLSVFLGGVTYDSYQGARTEERIQTAVAEVVGDVDGARLQSVEVERTDDVLFREPHRAVVTVGYGDSERPSITASLDERIDAAAGRDVRTAVRYLLTERA